MGHGGHLRDEYLSLVDRLAGGTVGLPEPATEEARQAWQEILETLYTPEDAALVARLPLFPTRLGELAVRLDMEPDALRERLEPLCCRGVVLDVIDPQSGEPSYLVSPPVIGFFEFSMMRLKDSLPQDRLARAFEAYTHGDETFPREVFGTETVVGRALVDEDTVTGGEQPEVLDWDRATTIVEQAGSWAVTHCYCRHKALHLGKACDAPLEICLSLGLSADFVVRRQLARRISREEALGLLRKARDHGLVQIGDNVRDRPGYICNCCGCCCGQLQGINQHDLRAVSPSGYLPTHDPETCDGCSRCARACPVAALAMEPCRQEADPRSTLVPGPIEERCIGCGVCAAACRTGALTMSWHGRPRRLPANTVEKAVRMALEKGRLADLLFDAAASQGSRFMNRLVGAITRLPLVDRLVASEQARSLFVRAALAKVGELPGPDTSDAGGDD